MFSLQHRRLFALPVFGLGGSCLLHNWGANIVVAFSDQGWLGNLFRFLHSSSLACSERFLHVICFVRILLALLAISYGVLD